MYFISFLYSRMGVLIPSKTCSQESWIYSSLPTVSQSLTDPINIFTFSYRYIILDYPSPFHQALWVQRPLLGAFCYSILPQTNMVLEPRYISVKSVRPWTLQLVQSIEILLSIASDMHGNLTYDLFPPILFLFQKVLSTLSSIQTARSMWRHNLSTPRVFF